MTTKNTRSDLLTQLKDGIARLTSSEAWCDYLAFQSRFHHYSYGNALLIAAQCPAATHVAGFTTWRKLQRSVRKGEKAIWILAPMVGKRSANDDPDADQFVRGFKYVAVFDIGQTVGEVPPAVCTKLSGDDPSRFYVRFVEVARCFGFGVADYAFGDTTNGDCNVSEHHIRVEARNSPAQRIKTLVHELAHALLHERVTDRPLAELEAESTAYIVCRAMGMDTGDYSFGYVASWAGGGETAIANIKSSCGRIQKAASIILRSFDAEQVLAA